MIRQRTRASAAAGLLAAFGAGAVHAQADGSYYGVIDFSYGEFQPAGTEREHRYASNSMTASFAGVTGKYTFENGLAPGITLETFLRLEDLKTGRNDDDPLFSRNAFVSLGSPWGLWRAGRVQTPLFETVTRFNALGNSVFFSPAVRHVFASGGLDGVQGDFYWDRAVSYTLPRFEESSAAGTLTYARGPGDLLGDYWGVNGSYAFGLLSLAAAAQKITVDDGYRDGLDETAWMLNASYSFGLFKAFGQFGGTSDHTLEVRTRTGSAGLSVPVRDFTLLGQMAQTRSEGAAVDRKHTTFSGALLWSYDSQTELYIVGMEDRVRRQDKGRSVAVGVRTRF